MTCTRIRCRRSQELSVHVLNRFQSWRTMNESEVAIGLLGAVLRAYTRLEQLKTTAPHPPRHQSRQHFSAARDPPSQLVRRLLLLRLVDPSPQRGCLQSSRAEVEVEIDDGFGSGGGHRRSATSELSLVSLLTGRDIVVNLGPESRGANRQEHKIAFAGIRDPLRHASRNHDHRAGPDALRY